MAYARGVEDFHRFTASLPGKLQNNVLRGAARAAAKVIAIKAKSNTKSEEVRGSIKIASSITADGRIIGKVQTKGPGSYLAPWEEFGTAPHFISADVTQRRGLSIGTFNRRTKEGSLVIGGAFVGTTVHHPGARPNPFMRTALDTEERDAVAAAQAYINMRVAKLDLTTAPEADEE